MKNEKLDLLVNKVVEFNKPDVANYRGFLYSDSGTKYYIKIVDVTLGSIQVNDKIYLSDGDEQFITQSDKPKLMKVSLKSWHYRLVKFVLGSYAPTPKTMQNGCPYFWLLIFSILIVPFLLVWKIIVFIVLLFPRTMMYVLEKTTISWLNAVDDATAYDLHYEYNNAKMPLTARIFFKNTDKSFMDYFLLEKYDIKRNLNSKEYQAKRDELEKKWEAWLKEIREANKKRWEIEEQKQAEKLANEMKARKKAHESKLKWEKRLQPINNLLNKIFNSISEIFTIKKDLKNVIKRTKQITGALITIFLLSVTYFIIIGLVLIIMTSVDLCIEYWTYLAIIGVILAVVGIIHILNIFFTGWIQGIVFKYKKGKKVWYVEPIIYLIYYPIKLIVLTLAYTIIYVVWTPFKYIIYTIIWKIFLVNLGKFSWKCLSSLGRGLISSTGIFGEYFNASYTDYCPGIEWVDTEDELSN